jgi:hypothetical protein
VSSRGTKISSSTIALAGAQTATTDGSRKRTTVV